MIDDDRQPAGDLFEAKTLFQSFAAMARATAALQTATEQLVLSTGNSMAGAVSRILFDASLALTNELGEQFTQLGQSAKDPETRAWVAGVLTRLNESERPRETVPPEPDPPASHADDQKKVVAVWTRKTWTASRAPSVRSFSRLATPSTSCGLGSLASRRRPSPRSRSRSTWAASSSRWATGLCAAVSAGIAASCTRAASGRSLSACIRSLQTGDRSLAPLAWDLTEKLARAGHSQSDPRSLLVPLGDSALFRVPGHEALIDEVGTVCKQAYQIEVDPEELAVVRKQYKATAMDPFDETLGGS